MLPVAEPGSRAGRPSHRGPRAAGAIGRGGVRGIGGGAASRGPVGCPPVPVRLVVLVSGTGSNLQALLDASADPAYGAQVVAVGADRPGIPALDKAHAAGVPSFVLRVADFPDRAALGRGVHRGRRGAPAGPDRLGRVHEARRLRVPRAGSRGATSTRTPHCSRRSRGCTGLATPWPTASRSPAARCSSSTRVSTAGRSSPRPRCPSRTEDDEHSLHERIKGVERALLVDTVGRMARDGWSVRGRRVTIP